jgi:RHS repeat-associated protein
MNTVRRGRKPAFFQPFSAAFLTLKVFIAAVVVAAVSLYGLSAPAFAAPPPVKAQAAVPASTGVTAPAMVPMVDPGPTTAGVFVPAQGRLVDTRDGTGGVTGPLPVNTWTAIQVTGRVGIPNTGVGSVVVSLTVVAAPADSWSQLASNTERPDTQTTNLFAGTGDTVSNTSIVPVGTDGMIALRSSVSQQYVIEVQGYFTSGTTPAPGGYAPIPTSRVVDTRNGTGIPTGTWSTGDVKTVTLKNIAGIPDTAGAVFANVILISTDPETGNPTLYPYPAGGVDPGAPLHYRAKQTTSVGATLDLNAAGQVSFRVAWNTYPVHVVVDVEGYFDGQVSDSSYHSLATRVLDTRTTARIAAGGTLPVAVAGVNGLPAASSDLAGVVMNITPINYSGTPSGYLRVYPSDEPEPAQSMVNYTVGPDIISNVIVVRPGTTDGKINVKNMGSNPVDVVIDAQGWFTNAHLLPPATGTNGAASGSRGSASVVTHGLTDGSAVTWNPTNGNASFIGRLLNIRGIGQDLNLAWRYNSLNDARPTLSLGRIEAALRVDGGTGKVTYTAPDGGWYTFAPSGSTWTVPAGLNASLTHPTSNEYRIRFNDTGITNVYTDDGANYALSRSFDANTTSPNTITYTHTGGLLTSSTDTQGRTVTYAYTDVRNRNQPSSITDASLNRTINLEYAGAQGQLSKITDATGAVTTFAYNTAGKLTTLTDGRSGVTSLEYDASTRVSKITYGTGSTAQSIFTPAYPSGTSSTLTDPNGKTATYAYNAAKQVTSVTDPNGNPASATFDGHDNRLTSTNALGKTTTATYNANNSLTKITSPLGGGSGSPGEVSFTYPSPSGDALLNYRPTSISNSEGYATNVTYDANTNAPASTATPDDLGGSPKKYYQGDTLGTNCGAKPGSLCRAMDGNGNSTSYSYDTAGNPVTVTRPAPLGVISQTFDAVGRIATMTDGKNQTATYTYDANDRPTQIRYGSNCAAATCVSYTYDVNGNLVQRVDAAGTTTYAYDAQNRATSKTMAGTTTTVTYDGASNVLSFTDPTGTVTYGYDPANRLISLAEPGGSCPATPTFPNATKCTGFGYDTANRRTSTTYPTGFKNTTGYDNAGRLTNITAAPSGGAALAARGYAYTARTDGKEGSLRASVTTDAGTPTATTTTYGYDKLNRLTSAASGGITEVWTYDKNGNRTLATKTSAPTVYSAFNAADQLCWTGPATGSCATPPTGATSYAYDANGNTTTAGATTGTYNVFDQFTSSTTAGTTTNFTYAGPRNDERTTAGSTSFLNGTLGITQQTTAGATTSFIRDPNGTLISMRNSSGASFYYTTDALGSVILLTDSTQGAAASYTYDSWGNTTATGAQAANNPWQYAGGYKDTATGYTKFGARYYDATTGRFTQADPSGLGANRYLYAQCNPINRTDPSGLHAFGSADYWNCVGSQIIDSIQEGIFWGIISGALVGSFLGIAGILAAAVIGAVGGALEGALRGVVWGMVSCLWK